MRHRPPRLEALIFDVDGTLTENEERHREAFNQAFSEQGTNWHWTRPVYRELLRIAGGRERIRHYLARRDGAPALDNAGAACGRIRKA
jgi:beta-phosphoglucomutase-like phosphatase (HAD superfamily)